LRPEPEVLQLAEIDFVETLSGRLFGRRVVHGKSEKRAVAREKQVGLREAGPPQVRGTQDGRRVSFAGGRSVASDFPASS
jgi:hypothetical protein